MNMPTGTGDDLFRVAAVQMNRATTRRSTSRTALELIDRAAGAGARLVALPEVWTYLGPRRATATTPSRSPVRLIDLLAERARRHGIYLHGGSILEVRSGRAEGASTRRRLQPRRRYRRQVQQDPHVRRRPRGVATYEESATVKPGDEIVTFDIDGVTVGSGDLLRPPLPRDSSASWPCAAPR